MKRAALTLSAALLLGCAHHGRARYSIGHLWPWAHGHDDPEVAEQPEAGVDTTPAPVYHPPILYFAFNSARLRDSETDKLHDMLANLSGGCRITGYASPEGTDEYNLALGMSRAQAVAAYLGVSPKVRLEVLSLGEEAGVDNDDPELYWLDRRVMVNCQ